MSGEKEPARSNLEDRLDKAEAVYRKLGLSGLAELPLADANLLLQQKQLQFRDLPKGRDLSDGQQAAARNLELQISDIGAYVQSQLALISSPGLRIVRGFGGQTQQQQQPAQQRGYQKQRHVEHER